MAVTGFFHQNSSYNAVDIRRLITDEYATEGVLSSADLVGSVTSATQFQISTGRAIIEHDSAGSSKYLVYNDAAVTLTLSMPTSAKRRYLIYMVVHDQYVEGGAADSASILSATPNDGAAPSLPTLPSHAIPLYDITVTYQSTGNGLTHSTTVITDIRPRAYPRASTIPTGALQLYAGDTSTVPTGWLICNGASVSRATYGSLFAVIGTTYGSVDGSSFNVPDLRDRVPLGAGLTYTRGVPGGQKEVTLTAGQIPAHTHEHVENVLQIGQDDLFAYNAAWSPPGTPINEITQQRWTLENTPSGQPHNNMQPYLPVNYLIRT